MTFDPEIEAREREAMDAAMDEAEREMEHRLGRKMELLEAALFHSAFQSGALHVIGRIERRTRV